MKLAMTKTYRQNRAKFSSDDLDQYDGKWVAFSSDGQRIVASGMNIKELSDQIRAANEDPQDVVMERIEKETEDVHLGAAELL
jgi:Family of unknown function (DUF5678)